MNTSANHSILSKPEITRSTWQTTVILALTFWLSSSLLLDWVVMPSLFVSGMMSNPGFTGAGALIFGLFNRIELICAAVTLTGVLAIRATQNIYQRKGYAAIALSGLLLAIALLYTYVLTPEMSGLGMQLNLFEPIVEVPGTMTQLHISYWALELFKFAGGSLLLSLCYRNRV